MNTTPSRLRLRAGRPIVYKSDGFWWWWCPAPGIGWSRRTDRAEALEGATNCARGCYRQTP